MLNAVYYYTMESPNTSKYHRSNRSSPALPINNVVSQRPTPQINRQNHLPPLSPRSVQCSAYFLSRMDLNNYTIETLQQTIDNVVSGPKSKGLKVKLSLPDEGLVIDNIPDPNQSWMYRSSELLYFWRDPRHDNLVVVVTLNRRNVASLGSFSASIFRLRGSESVRMFLQRAQQFFARLSERNNPKNSVKKSATIEQIPSLSKRPRNTSKPKEQSSIQPSPPSPTTSSPAEFDPRRMTSTNNSSFDLYNRRTYSETTISSDSRISSSKGLNSHLDDDEKLTTISNYLANEYVGELVRELKELRVEIAALKFEHKSTPTVRSISTSPIFISSEKFPRTTRSSPNDIDAQTQTDLAVLESDIKIESTNENSMTNKRKNDQMIIDGNKRVLFTSNEEVRLTNSSSSEPSQATSKIYENIPPIFNSKPSDAASIPMDTEFSLPVQTGDVVSFRSSLEDTIAPPENIYENIPILMPINNSDPSKGKPYLRVTIANDPNTEYQQEYLKHLFGPQNGISSLLPPPTPGNKSNTSSSIITQTLPNSQYYSQQVSFSNYLTNPLFKTDKQLLANTIANQFGLDLNSLEVQKLMSNQHLFVHNKRTFANVIWPISAEEENVLCSSPTSIISPQTINIQTADSNGSSTGKSILKPRNSPRFSLKGQHISWGMSSE